LSELHRRRTVVVIGAGIAGLSAAYELSKAGFDVTVVEQKHLAGGRMAEEMVGSFMNITGASGLNSYYAEMFDLCSELGMMDEVVPLPRFGTGTATDMTLTYPMSNNPSRLDLLRSPVLSWKSKLKLASLLPDMRAARRSIDPCLIHTAAEFDDEGMSAYLIRKVGRDFLEYIVSPLLNVALAWNVDTISRAAFLAKVSHVTESNGYVFKDGIGALTRRLASQLDVRLNSTVTRVARSPDGRGRVVHFESEAGPEQLAADIVVCAVPGDAVSGVVEDQGAWERSFFSAGTPYAQFAMIVYVLKEEVKEPGGLYFVRDTQTPLNFYKTYAGDPTREGRPPHLWVTFSPERLNHLFATDGSDLLEKARPYVRDVYPSLDQDVKEVIPQFHGYRMPEFPVGQVRRIRDFLYTQEAGPRDLYYVGDYLGGPGTGNALAIARRTSRQIIRNWKPQQ
jgi:oxygen-dependent protoporphyrinogen oxidase